MQTFLPYPSFTRSARVLDNRRLGNQCYRECLTLIRGGWKNHPASKMWRGYEAGLALYALQCALEMHRRGSWRKEVCDRWISHFSELNIHYVNKNGKIFPPWLGREDVHSSHRSVLFYKNYEHYGQFGWEESPAILGEDGKLPYVWPILEKH